MPRKRLLVSLPADAYRRLADLAEQEERVIDQQASLLLKRLLMGATVSVGDVSAERIDAQHGADGRIPAAMPGGCALVSADKKDARCAAHDAPIVRADWTVGLRTSAWDRLWNMILSDLGPLSERDVRKAKEPEGQDG